MALNALLLDLDGTIWPSRAWYDGLFRGGAGTGGGPIATRLRRAGYTKASFAATCRRGSPPLACYDGVLDTLGQFNAAGTPIGVVTNLPGWMAEPMLEAAGA